MATGPYAPHTHTQPSAHTCSSEGGTTAFFSGHQGTQTARQSLIQDRGYNFQASLFTTQMACRPNAVMNRINEVEASLVLRYIIQRMG